MAIKDLEPRDVARRMAERSILLVDVREPAEYEVERIHGAVLFPLSTFDPKSLPQDEQRIVVFQCGTGMRSGRAVAACQAAGLAIDSHLRGGLKAWKAAGLPTISTDADTGALHESR